MAITQQEAWTRAARRRRRRAPVRVPELVSEVVERVAFEARTDKRVDKRSGVSQRMPITVMENVVSNAERRAVRTGEPEVVPRIADVFAALPAITGKLELEYEGELVGGASIARELIRRAADATLKARAGTPNLDKVIVWFDEGGALQVDDEQPSALVARAFSAVPELLDVVHRTGLATADDPGATAAACELVLEALVARKKISRNDAGQYGRAQAESRRRPGQDLFG
jgi:magnesium chelatase subunit I